MAFARPAALSCALRRSLRNWVRISLHNDASIRLGRAGDLSIRKLACAPAVISIVPGATGKSDRRALDRRIDDSGCYGPTVFALLFLVPVRCVGTKSNPSSTPPAAVSNPAAPQAASLRRSLAIALYPRPAGRSADGIDISLRGGAGRCWRTPTRSPKEDQMKAAVVKQEWDNT